MQKLCKFSIVREPATFYKLSEVLCVCFNTREGYSSFSVISLANLMRKALGIRGFPEYANSHSYPLSLNLNLMLLIMFSLCIFHQRSRRKAYVFFMEYVNFRFLVCIKKIERFLVPFSGVSKGVMGTGSCASSEIEITHPNKTLTTC